MAELLQRQVIHNLPTRVHVSFSLCEVQWITAGYCDWRTKVESMWRAFERVWSWIGRILCVRPHLVSFHPAHGGGRLASDLNVEAKFVSSHHRDHVLAAGAAGVQVDFGRICSCDYKTRKWTGGMSVWGGGSLSEWHTVYGCMSMEVNTTALRLRTLWLHITSL